MDSEGEDSKTHKMSREEAEHHDFDQRHDGPFQGQPGPHENRPSVQVMEPTRRHSGPALNAQSPDTTSRSNTGLFGGRKSMQAERSKNMATFSPPGRASTQMQRGGAGRPSRDFDVRRDGPYGRPSLTMTRRRSSGTPLPRKSTDGRRPTLPAMTADEAEAQAEEKQLQELGEASTNGESQDPIAPSLETLQVDPAFEPEPPPLNYSLWPRKWSIVIFWSLIVIDCTAMPIGLYFGLWYGTNLSPNVVFSIVTAALGGVSILEYVLRFRRLWRKDSTCRVIGARRGYLDWFHWNFSFGWFIVVLELIIGTVPANPPIRLLAMPLTSMLYAFACELVLVDILRLFHVPAPIRISSIPKGSQLRPGIYSIIEDVCAVDGSGGTEFRENLNRRYEASHTFRAMLRRLGEFWAAGSMATAVVCTILIFTVQHEAAYVIGWSVPFIWAGIWTALTFWYVHRMLIKEKKDWAEEVAAKSAA